MDIVKEMQEAYYRSLHGVLIASTPIPLWYGSVPKDQNPEIYGLITTTTNTASDTIATKHSLYVTQVTLVVKNSTYANTVTLNTLADQAWSVIEPEKGKTLIDPIGFQIQYTRKALDIPQPPYLSSDNKIVCERIIQVENRIFHQIN